MFILFCCRWSTKDKCYQHLLIYTNKLVGKVGAAPTQPLGNGFTVHPSSTSSGVYPYKYTQIKFLFDLKLL